MRRYDTGVPRLAFGIAAIAMTAITIAAAVVAPVRLDSSGADRALLAAAKVIAPAPIEVAIIPGQIEVVGIRSPDLAAERAQGVQKTATHFHVMRLMGQPQI
jgi:hypothetical protein